MKFRATTLLACAPFILAIPAQANLISNGTFASTCNSLTFCTYYAGDSVDIPGWTVTQGSVDLVTGYWQAPPGGGNSIDLDGYYQAGGLAQTSFVTGTGTTYTVSFYLSGNPDGGDPLKSLEVLVDGQAHDFNYDTATEGNTHADMKYVLESFTFVANTTMSTLEFESLDAADSAFGPVIGDVNVVPEPLSIGLLGTGLVIAGFAGRRKSRKQKA